MELLVGAATNVGKVRDHNEDSFCVNRKHKIFIVADGMGGHAAGEIASNQLKDYIEEYLLKEDRKTSTAESLTEGIQAANKAIYHMGIQDANKRGMGTTATILTCEDAKYWIAQVGDSRAYRLRKGDLEQLTRDHSRVFQLYESGLITKDEIEEHPLSNVITRSIGNHSTVDPDIYEGKLELGDRYLLCSDGLTGEVRDAHLQSILETHKDPQEAVDVLIETALGNGGKDNITVVVLDVREGEDKRRKTVPMTLEELKSLPPPPGSVDRKDARGAEVSQPDEESPAKSPEQEPEENPTEVDNEDKGIPKKPASPPPVPSKPGRRGDEAPEDAVPSSAPAVLPWLIAIVFFAVLGIYLTSGGSSAAIEIATTPPGAEIYLNQRMKDVTPLKLEVPGKGTYQLELRLEGYVTRSDEVRVEDGETVKRSYILERAGTP